MSNSIIDSPLSGYSKPWWQPFLFLSVTLYGILMLDWKLQPIVFLFWWEIILMVGAMLIRVLFAMKGKPFFDDILKKIMLFGFGAILSCAMIMLAVTFSFKVFEDGMNAEGFEQIPQQMKILIAGYVLGLILHYFINGRYKTASPAAELVSTSLHLVIMVILLMVLAMHLIPAYPQLDQATWVGISVVLVKFVIDWQFTRSSKSAQVAFSE